MKPEKAREIEDSLIRSAQMGAIASQIDEPQLVKILNDLSEKKTQTKVTVSIFSLLFVCIWLLLKTTNLQVSNFRMQYQRRSALDDD